MIKKLGLGRNLTDLGINELLSEIETQQRSHQFRNIPIEFIEPGKYQPRQKIVVENLTDLVTSIKSQGIIQPLLLRPTADNRYEIIAGERRWRAAQLAGLHEVPALIRELKDEEALAISLIENIQRENLNALEEALALQRLLGEFNFTHQTLADTVGKSRSSITNYLRLLELEAEVKQFVAEGQLAMGHARALLGLKGTWQRQAADLVVRKNLSVRATEQLVQQFQTTGNQPVKKKIVLTEIINLQKELSDKLGAKVLLNHSARGSGRLIIKYNTLDELDGVIKHITPNPTSLRGACDGAIRKK